MNIGALLYKIFKYAIFAGTAILLFSLVRDALLAPYSSVSDNVGAFDGVLDAPIFWCFVLLNLIVALTELFGVTAAASQRAFESIFALGLAASVVALGLVPDARVNREIFWAKRAYTNFDARPAETGCHSSFPGLAHCGLTCLDRTGVFCELLFVGNREALLFGGKRTCGVSLIRDRERDESESGAFEKKVGLLLRDYKVDDVARLHATADYEIVRYCMK